MATDSAIDWDVLPRAADNAQPNAISEAPKTSKEIDWNVLPRDITKKRGVVGELVSSAVEPFKAMVKAPTLLSMNDDELYEAIQRESARQRSVEPAGGISGGAARIAGGLAAGVGQFAGATALASETGPAAPFIGPGIAFSASGAWEGAMSAGVKALQQGKSREEVVAAARNLAKVGATAGAGSAIAFGASGLIPKTASALLRTTATAGAGVAAGVGSQLAENVAEKEAGLEVSPTEGLLEQAIVMGLIPVLAHAKDLYRQARTAKDPEIAKTIQKSADEVAKQELAKADVSKAQPTTARQAAIVNGLKTYKETKADEDWAKLLEGELAEQELKAGAKPTSVPETEAVKRRRLALEKDKRQAERAKRPTVPGTTEDQQIGAGQSAVEEIRDQELFTRAEVQKHFSETGGRVPSNEEAADLLRKAWRRSPEEPSAIDEVLSDYKETPQPEEPARTPGEVVQQSVEEQPLTQPEPRSEVEKRIIERHRQEAQSEFDAAVAAGDKPAIRKAQKRLMQILKVQQAPTPPAKPAITPKPPLENLPRSSPAFKPEVPTTGAEERETVLETIRKANARTKEEIRALFPNDESMTREKAAKLRDEAWGKQGTAEITSREVPSGARKINPLNEDEINEARWVLQNEIGRKGQMSQSDLDAFNRGDPEAAKKAKQKAQAAHREAVQFLQRFNDDHLVQLMAPENALAIQQGDQPAMYPRGVIDMAAVEWLRRKGHIKEPVPLQPRGLIKSPPPEEPPAPAAEPVTKPPPKPPAAPAVDPEEERRIAEELGEVEDKESSETIPSTEPETVGQDVKSGMAAARAEQERRKPWMMTKAEYGRHLLDLYPDGELPDGREITPEVVEELHRASINVALKGPKRLRAKVPDEVLADYPDLAGSETGPTTREEPKPASETPPAEPAKTSEPEPKVAEGLTLSEIKRRLPVGYDPESVRIENGKIIAKSKPDYGGEWNEVSLKKATARTIDPTIPKPDSPEYDALPMGAKGAAGEYWINEEIIRTGMGPNPEGGVGARKKVSKQHITDLQERQKQVIKNFYDKKGKSDASKISETTTVHGDVREQPGQGAREVSAEEGGKRVQPQTPGRVQENVQPSPQVGGPLKLGNWPENQWTYDYLKKASMLERANRAKYLGMKDPKTGLVETSSKKIADRAAQRFQEMAAAAAKPEKITAAAYVDESGIVHEGANHPEILAKLGVKGFEDPESRNTPQFGFVTNKREFIEREEAAQVATKSGQNLKEFEPGEPAHSDEIASPVEPSKPISEVPKATQPPPTTLPATMETARQLIKMSPKELFEKTQSFNRLNLEIGRNATPEEYEELKQLKQQAIDRRQAAADKASEARKKGLTKKAEDATNDYVISSTLDQFYNEAIAEYERTHPKPASAATQSKTPVTAVEPTPSLERPTPAAAGTLTPMMKQYQEIKAGLPKDALLMFRLGDFYEFFWDDATKAAETLKVALTKRGDMPMAGIPFHAAEQYIKKLLKAGYRVAIADAKETPEPGKLTKREVTDIYEPIGEGPLTPEERLDLNELRIVKENRGSLGKLNERRLAALEDREAQSKAAERESKPSQEEIEKQLRTRGVAYVGDTTYKIQSNAPQADDFTVEIIKDGKPDVSGNFNNRDEAIAWVLRNESGIAEPTGDINQFLNPPIPDAKSAQEKLSDTNRIKAALRDEMKEAEKERDRLEQLVTIQRGPRYKRGRVKTSAKASDLKSYRDAQKKANDLYVQISSLERSVQEEQRIVDQSIDTKMISDPKQPLLRRLSRAVKWYQDKGKVPDALVKARDDEMRRVILEKYPDATEEEIQRISPQVERNQYFYEDPWKEPNDIPKLADLRRGSLKAALEKESQQGGSLMSEMSDEFHQRLQRYLKDLRTHGEKPSPIDPVEDLSSKELADLKKGILSEGKRVRKEAAEAEKLRVEQEAAEKAKHEQLLADAQKVVDSAGRVGTVGGRTAKEVKEDLGNRIENAINETLGQDKVTLKRRSDDPNLLEYAAEGENGGFSLGEVEKTDKGKFKVKVSKPGFSDSGITVTVPTLEQAEWAIKAMASSGKGKAIVAVPGDGVYQLHRFGESLLKLWAAAKKLDVSGPSKRPSELPTGGSELPQKAAQESASQAVQMYGSAKKALQKIQNQMRILDEYPETKYQGPQRARVERMLGYLSDWAEKEEEPKSAVPTGEGHTIEGARAEAEKAFGKLSDRISFVHEPDNPSGAVIIGRDRIQVNAAKVAPGTVERVMLEEGLHGVWEDPSVQDAWKDFRRSVTEYDIAAERSKRKGLDTDRETLKEEAAISKLLANPNTPFAKKVWDAVIAALDRIFGVKVPDNREQLLEAARNFLREGGEPGREEFKFAAPTGGRGEIPFSLIQKGISELNKTIDDFQRYFLDARGLDSYANETAEDFFERHPEHKEALREFLVGEYGLGSRSFELDSPEHLISLLGEIKAGRLTPRTVPNGTPELERALEDALKDKEMMDVVGRQTGELKQMHYAYAFQELKKLGYQSDEINQMFTDPENWHDYRREIWNDDPALATFIEKYVHYQTPEQFNEHFRYATPTVGKSPIEQYTEAIKDITGEKAPLGERIKQAFDLGERMSTAKTVVGRSIDGIRAIGDSLIQKWQGVNDIDELMREKGYLSKSAEQRGWLTRLWEKTAKRAVPRPSRQAAIRKWIDAGGDMSELRRGAAETKPEFRQAYVDAQNLTPDELKVAQEARNYFEKRLDEAIDADVLKEGVEDYIHRMYEHRPNQRERALAYVQSSILKTNPALAKRRVFQMDWEAEKEGFKPVQSFIPAIAEYETSLSRAIAARKFVARANELRDPEDNRPIVDIKGVGIPITDEEGERTGTLIKPQYNPAGSNEPNSPNFRGDYVTRDYPALQKWKWVASDTDGKPIFVQGDVSIHPKYVHRFDALLEASRVRYGRYGAVLRPALAISSAFKQTMLDLSGFHQVQEVLHGVEHKVNPFNLVQDIDFNNPNIDGLLKGGMTIGGDYRYQREGLIGSSLIKQIPILGPLAETYHNWLFQDFIPRLKTTMALKALERNRERYAGKLSEEQIFNKTAFQANSAFGGLNYTMLERSKTAQDLARLIMLAPDFLESRGRFAAEALARGGGKFFSNEQRSALLWGALTMYVAARVLNKMTDDQYHFEPENAFSWVHNGQAYGLRTVQGDILHLASKPLQFAMHRLNPVFGRTMLEAVTQRDEFGRKRSAAEIAWDTASNIMPISLRSSRERTLWESLSNAFGITNRRWQDTDKAFDLARKWKDKHGVGERGEFIYDPDKDPLRPLKIALSRNDDVGAASEIKKLVDSKQYTLDRLDQFFRRYGDMPFTGSKANDRKFMNDLTEDEKITVGNAKQHKEQIKRLYQRARGQYRQANAGT